MLLITGSISSKSKYHITWHTLLYSFINKVVVYTYAFIGGMRLLRLIRKYSLTRPTKLVWNIYLLIGIMIFIIPYYGVLLAFFVLDLERFSYEIMLLMYLIGTNICEIIPIGLFMSNLKLLKRYTQQTFSAEPEFSCDNESEDTFIMKALCPSTD